MPFVANEIFMCEMVSISSKFFTPELTEEKDFVEYNMTPDSSYKASGDSLNGCFFPSLKNKDETKKPDLVINFNEDCEVELLEPN